MAKAKKKIATRKARAKKAAGLHAKSFPNESAAYRKKRDALLKAEMGLRREIEKVAALRRKLPAGGTMPVDYLFEEIAPGGGSAV